MSKYLHRLLLCGLAIVGLLCGQAKASTISFTDTFSKTATVLDHDFIPPLFNPILATLTSVMLSLSDNIAADLQATNFASTAPITVIDFGSVTLTNPGPTTPLTAPFSLSHTETLA